MSVSMVSMFNGVRLFEGSVVQVHWNPRTPELPNAFERLNDRH